MCRFCGHSPATPPLLRPREGARRGTTGDRLRDSLTDAARKSPPPMADLSAHKADGSGWQPSPARQRALTAGAPKPLGQPAIGRGEQGQGPTGETVLLALVQGAVRGVRCQGQGCGLCAGPTQFSCGLGRCCQQQGLANSEPGMGGSRGRQRLHTHEAWYTEV